MTSENPAKYYTDRYSVLETELKALTQKRSLLAWLRLISFLISIAAIIIMWNKDWGIVIISFVIPFAAFLWIVSKDLANSQSISNTKLLISIQREELNALEHNYTHFTDGSSLEPATHEYTHDLDIFGRASLFQYVNRARSEQGNKLLSEWLLSPAGLSTIKKRQEAVKELSSQPEWRQQLEAFGTINNITTKTQKHIETWLKEENQFINKFHWKLFRFLLPAISWALLFLYLFGVIALSPFLTSMVLMLAISFSITRLIMPAYSKLNRITSELETLSASIEWIEKKDLTTGLLKNLKQHYGENGDKASTKIKALKKILDRLDYRLNPLVFIPLSIFLLWDLQQIFSLEKWKLKNQKNISEWYSSLAEFETISSFANLSFNHPQWSYPEILEGDAVFSAIDLGHPLIPPGKRVDNSFATEGVPKISLITGSNMAGKSTFLRSVGVNIVLAMSGAPVCAKQLRVSPVKIMSSMRVSDNLEENASTFYAELKKLRDIIEAVNRKEKVFLLLDEMLRGTNSADRHTGSAALIRQLINHNGAGLIATHDLELASIEKEFPQAIHNYHFDVQVEGEELYFDYKLKEGICQSMNASILMRKIGIEIPPGP